MFFLKKKMEEKCVERKAYVMDKDISSWVHSLESIYEDELPLEQLKKIIFLNCEKQGDEWTVWRKCCYYGGCVFDPVVFQDEYEAYKYAAIKYLFSRIHHREHELSGASTKLADVNYGCPKYNECSGMDG